MQLVLKLPKDKPPFIGIQFPTDYSGSKTNVEWFLDHGALVYQASIEFRGPLLNLKLKCDAGELVYRDVEYNAQKLKNFVQLTSKTDRFNFGHIISTGDGHAVIRARNNKLMVLAVDQFTVVEEY